MSHHKNFVATALALLSAAGCTYFVGEPDGTNHGALPSSAIDAPAVAPSAAPSFAPQASEPAPRVRGDLIAYIQPLLRSMAAGETRRVPIGPYAACRAGLHSSVCNYARKTWGRGSTRTFLDSSGAIVVLRKAAQSSLL